MLLKSNGPFHSHLKYDLISIMKSALKINLLWIKLHHVASADLNVTTIVMLTQFVCVCALKKKKKPNRRSRT